MKKLISLALVLVFVLSISFSALAEGSDPTVYINGKKIVFQSAPYKDGEMWMLPFKELMSQFGVEIVYDEESAQYKGMIDDIEISVEPNSYNAVYDLIPFELEHICKSVDGDVMVQLDFIEKIYEVSVKTAGDGTLRFQWTPIVKEKDDFDLDEYLASYPQQEVVLNMEDIFTTGSNQRPESLKLETIDIEGQPFDKALRMDSTVKLERGYEAQITTKNKTPLTVDDICVLTFWGRGIRTGDETGRCFVNVCFEKNSGNYDKSLATNVYLSGEWERYQFVFSMITSNDVGAEQFGLRVGYAVQQLEIADVKIVNYGRGIDKTKVTVARGDSDSRYSCKDETYYGREPGALWREEALKRIEKNRVRDISVSVRDEAGNPVPNAKVSADMTQSEFKWGTLVQGSYLFENGGDLRELYEKALLDEFNTVTINTVQISGYYNPKYRDVSLTSRLANYVREKGLNARYHNLFWDSASRIDGWLEYYPATPETVTEKDLIEAYAGQASRTLYPYGDVFYEMDIANELTMYDDYQKKFGTDWLADVMKITRDICDDVNPDIDIIINDAGINGQPNQWSKPTLLKEMIADYLSKGVKIDGVGFETHMDMACYPQLLYNQFDYVAEDVDVIAVTEYDFKGLAPKEIEEQVEQDFFEDLLIMSYSHPKMSSFVMWDFTDYNHWRGEAPLYNREFQPKECEKIWKEYTQNKWFTRTGGETDKDGSLVMRGHRGSYKITVEANGHTAETTLVVGKNGENSVSAVVGKDGITLSSSEEAAKKETKYNAVMENRFRDHELTNMWKKLYENKVDKITAFDGRDIGFLKDGGGDIYVLGGDGAITATLEETVKDGFVSVKIPQDENIGVCSVYGCLDNGEWQYIGNFGSGDEKYIGYSGEMNRFKIVPAGAQQVRVNKIHISKKEPVI